MTLKKAIELLNLDLKDPGSVAIEDVNEAEILAIGALELIDKLRIFGNIDAERLLPGETRV